MPWPRQKKSPSGHEHARVGRVVPGDLEQALAVVVPLGHPDVGDLRRAGDVGQHGASPGGMIQRSALRPEVSQDEKRPVLRSRRVARFDTRFTVHL